MSAGIWKLGTQNAITTTLDGSITDTDQTIALTSSTGLQYPGVITIDRLDANSVDTPTAREYVSYTGISGNSLTGCTRGCGGSTAQSHGSNALVEETWSVSHWNDFVDAFTAEHGLTGVHADALVTSLKASGAVVTTGTSDVTIVTPKALADAGIVVTLTNAVTLTNKRITKRVVGTTSSATPTPNADTTDIYTLTALAEAAEFGAPTGTPTNGQPLVIRIKPDATPRALTWNAAYVAGGVALPTTTVASKILTVGFMYNTDNSLNKWMCIASVQEA